MRPSRKKRKATVRSNPKAYNMLASL